RRADKLGKAMHKNCIVGTKKNLVALRRRAFRSVVGLQTTANEPLTFENRFDRWQEVALDARLMNIAQGALTKSLSHHFRGRFKAEKEDPCPRREFANPPRGFHPVKARQPDVK